MELFLTSCVERGTLDQALRELGFVKVQKVRPAASRTMPFGWSYRFPCALKRALSASSGSAALEQARLCIREPWLSQGGTEGQSHQNGKGRRRSPTDYSQVR